MGPDGMVVAAPRAVERSAKARTQQGWQSLISFRVGQPTQ